MKFQEIGWNESKHKMENHSVSLKSKVLLDRLIKEEPRTTTRWWCWCRWRKKGRERMGSSFWRRNSSWMWKRATWHAEMFKDGMIGGLLWSIFMAMGVKRAVNSFRKLHECLNSVICRVKEERLLTFCHRLQSMFTYWLIQSVKTEHDNSVSGWISTSPHRLYVVISP